MLSCLQSIPSTAEGVKTGMLTQFSNLTVVHTVPQKALMPAGGCDGKGSCGPCPSELSQNHFWHKKLLCLNCSSHPTSAVSVLTALEFYFPVSLLSVLLPAGYIPQERHNLVLGEFFIQDPHAMICDLIYTEPGKKGMKSLNQYILETFITCELTNVWRPMHFLLIF